MILSDDDPMRKLKAGVAAAGLAAAGLAILSAWVAWDRSYRIDSSSICEPSEVRCLDALAGDLKRIVGQDPVNAGPASARAVALWVRQSPQNQAADWPALLAPGSDPGLRQGNINGALMILAQHPDELDPGQVRAAKTEDDATAMVLGVLRRHTAARQERDAIAKLAGVGLEPIWAREGWPGWPETGFVRRQLRRIAGRPTDGTQYLAAVIGGLEPATRLAAWYDALAAFEEQPLGDPARAGFWLVQDRTQPVVPDGWSARLNVRLDYRRPAADGPRGSLIAATGLVLHDVLAEPAPGAGTQGGLKPRLDPASGQLSVDVPRFAAFLHATGLPEAFELSEVTPRRGDDPRSLDFLWDLTLRHRDFESFSFRETLAPGSGAGSNLESAVGRLSARVRERFRKSLLAIREDRGWEVSFRPAKGKAGPDLLDVTLSSPKLGPLPFTVQVGDDGRLSWSDQATLADRRRLAGLLAGQDAGLVGLEGRMRVAALTYDRNSQGRLRGTFSLSAENDREPCPFSIGPDGTAEIALSARRRRELADARRPAARPSAEDGGAEAEPTVTSRAVTEVLASRFAPIAPMVEIEPGEDGRSLTLGLHLADYPTVMLGPAPVRRREDLETVVAGLLGPTSVTNEAAAQWGRSVKSPRWGTVRATVRGWDPIRGRATVFCRLMLYDKPEVVIPWPDDLTAEDGRWRSADAEQIAPLVEPYVRSLKQSVRDLARSQGFDLEVDVDPDGFGPGSWLRLHPPAARFRCRMEPYPGFGWKVGLERVQLDGQGLHLDPAFSFQIRTSIPLPPGSPVMNLSDPLIRINFASRELSVEAKATPPWLPLRQKLAINTAATAGVSAAEGEFDLFEGVRLDNPWLYLAYLNTRVGGSLSRRELEGGAELVFLRTHELGSGYLKMRFLEGGVPQLHGRMTAGGSAASNLPKLDGELWVDSQRGFETRAEVDVAGMTLHGKLALRTAEVAGVREPRAEFVGKGRFPWPIGVVDVTGVSDMEFRSPVFEAHGTVDLDVASLRYRCELSRRSGFKYWYEWIRPGQQPRMLVFEGTELDEFAMREIEDDLRKAMASGPADADSPPLNPAQQSAVNAAPPVDFTDITLTERPGKGGPTPPSPVLDTDGERRELVPTAGPVEVLVKDGHLIVRSRKTEGVHLDLPLADLGLTDRAVCRGAVWLPRDPSTNRKVEVLILDYRDRRALRARMKSSTALDDLHDLAGDLKDIMSAMADSARQALFQRAAIDLVDARTIDPAARLELASAGSCIVRYRSPRFGEAAIFSWLISPQRVNSATVYEQLVPADREAELWPRLSRLTLPEDGLTVLAAEPGESGRIALMSALAGKIRVWSDAKEAGTLAVTRVPGERRRPFLRSMADCAEASWRTVGPRLAGAGAWFGPEGICIRVEGPRGGWWLFPAAADAAPVEFQAQLPVFLGRAQFAEAHLDDGGQLWPERFASPTLRVRVTDEELAEAAVQSWAEAKTQGWRAHPMGLLTGLVLERAPHSPAAGAGIRDNRVSTPPPSRTAR